jgi:hypothetical protein
MNYSTGLVRKLFPAADVLHCLGNHDATPNGDVFTSTSEMAWLYEPLAGALWAKELSTPTAKASVTKGGWYSVSTGPKQRIIGVNTNYWASTNKGELSSASSAASKLGAEQWAWVAGALEAAAAAGEKVWFLAHIPPEYWMPAERWKLARLLTEHKGLVTAQLFGHTHQDYFELTRACAPPSPPCANASCIDWLE